MANSKNAENVINHIRKRKADLVRVMGGKCCVCGFSSFQEALDFHHINPEEKDFGICASNAATKSLEKQLKELRKCALVCSNCHRGIHAGLISLPLDYIFFNEDIAEELKKENYELKHGKIRYCERCRKVISRDATYCVDCRSIINRKADRPSREELKEQIRSLPFTQVGKKYGVTDNCIRKWCISYNLPSKKSEIVNISEKEWIEI